jgi:hypothetical protein
MYNARPDHPGLTQASPQSLQNTNYWFNDAIAKGQQSKT